MVLAHIKETYEVVTRCSGYDFVLVVLPSDRFYLIDDYKRFSECIRLLQIPDIEVVVANGCHDTRDHRMALDMLHLHRESVHLAT